MLQKIIFLFISFTILNFCSNNTSLLPFNEADPSTLVEGSVSVVSGNLYHSQDDIIVNGYEPIVLKSQYISFIDNPVSNYFKNKDFGWSLLNYLEATGQYEKYLIPEENGTILEYSIAKDEDIKKYMRKFYENKKEKKKRKQLEKSEKLKKRFLVVDQSSLKEFITNCPRNEISGRKNLKNNVVEVFDAHTIKVLEATSGERFYRRNNSNEKFLLRYIIRPNGNKVLFSYDKKKSLSEIRTTNSDESIIYAWVKFSYPSQNPKEIHVRTSDNRFLKYKFTKNSQNLSWDIIDSIDTNEYFQKFSYPEINKFMLGKISFPNNRYLRVRYYDKKKNYLDNFTIDLRRDDPRICRVKALLAPVGDDEKEVITHKFFYETDYFYIERVGYNHTQSVVKHYVHSDGFSKTYVNSSSKDFNKISAKKKMFKTTVLDAYDNKTEYFYSLDDYRLQEIKKYQKLSGIQQLHSIEKFAWGTKEEEISNLIAKSILDRFGKVLYAKRYFYDEMGSPIKETVYGNISGQSNANIVLDDKSLPVNNSVESYSIHRKYSQDGRLLLLEEKYNNGLKYIYKYYPEKILVLAKYTLDNEKIVKRQFYEYDENFILIKKIEDNGLSSLKENHQSVTISKFTKNIPRKKGAFAGFADTIIEGYLDIEKGIEKQILKTELSYTDKGKIAQKDLFDANDDFAYSLKFKYNAKQDLIEETNAIGQKAFYKYDQNHNKIQEIDFSGKKTNFSYDFSNRLIKEEFFTKDGKVYTTRHKYDKKHNRIVTIDPFGNFTKFIYDAFGNVIKNIYPKILDQNGKTVNIEDVFEYDIFGNEILEKDLKGNFTKTSFNIFHKPILKIYPDSSKEKFIYNLDGTLKEYIDQENVKTRYFYDVFGNLLKTATTNSKSEHHFIEESFEYDAFGNLLKNIDPEKNITNFICDFAGRNISEEFIHNSNGKIEKKAIFYDSLGRRFKTNYSNIFTEVFLYDLLDRVIEENKINCSAQKVQFIKKFTYDESSNLNRIKKYPNNLESVETIYCDDFDRVLKKVDALGNETNFIYEDFNSDQNNINTRKEIEINPNNVKKITIFDTLDRIISIEKLSSDGKKISFLERFYDANSNLVKVICHKISENLPTSQITTLFEYDNMNRLKVKLDAFGSKKDQRVTKYEYYPSGLLKNIIKPDGVVLEHCYDDLKNLISLKSSDNSISYRYKYDKLNNLIESIDEINNLSIKRELDGRGKILSEKQANEIVLQYVYDDQARKSSITYPDKSKADYIYDGINLKEIIKKDSSGAFLYSHKFKEYDLLQNLLKELLICKNDCGQGEYEKNHCEYKIDKLGRRKSIISQDYYQDIEFDNLGRVVLNKTSDDQITYKYDDLDQIISENGKNFQKHYRFDSLYNLTKKDNKDVFSNDLNQTISIDEENHEFDLSGNLSKSLLNDQNATFAFDALDRLIQVIIFEKYKINYIYDSFDRRISKEIFIWKDNFWQKHLNKSFFYDYQNEIGSVDEKGDICELRVLGRTNAAEIGSSIAFELNCQIYAPSHGLFGSVVCIRNIDDESDIERYKYTAFGEEVKYSDMVKNPWRFSSKRVDEETNLINFGKRYYFPKMQSWISIDPAGYKDSMNLYQFDFNNPLIYKDLQGENVLGFCVGLGEMLLGGGLMLSGAALELATFGGYTICFGFQEAAGLSLITDGFVRTMSNGSDFSSFMNKGFRDTNYSTSTVSIPNDLSFPDIMEKRWGKKGRIDSTLPTDPFNDPDWEDEGHEKAKKAGHYRFKNKNTGKKIEFDKGKPGELGHKGHDHYHRPNPNAKNKYDSYLDEKGNPVPDKSDPSHLYPQKWKWWK
jgi:RHS repeat-associated protein